MSLSLVNRMDFKGHRISIYRESNPFEFIVRFAKGGIYNPDQDYFTDDYQDALGTAKHVLRTWTNEEIESLN